MRGWISLMACAAVSFVVQATCPPNPNWSYEGPKGPTHWAEQWPACQGRAQSPIDLPAAAPVQAGAAIEFHYQPFDLEVENTSHVIEVQAPAGTSYIMVGGHRYDLVQFHFHTPSEHRIAGKAAAMEIHFVHKDSAGKLAVVGILADDKTENSALKPIVTGLPVAMCDHRDQHVMFDPAALLPAARDYLTYGGSLTTPTCDEGVTWIVMTHPISTSAAQVGKLGPFGVNARPVQPLNGRQITHVGAGR